MNQIWLICLASVTLVIMFGNAVIVAIFNALSLPALSDNLARLPAVPPQIQLFEEPFFLICQRSFTTNRCFCFVFATSDILYSYTQLHLVASSKGLLSALLMLCVCGHAAALLYFPALLK